MWHILMKQPNFINFQVDDEVHVFCTTIHNSNRPTKLLYFQLVPKLGRGSPKPSLWNDTKDAYLLFVNSTRVYIHNVAMSIMPAIDTMFLIIVVKDLTWINTKKSSNHWT